MAEHPDAESKGRLAAEGHATPSAAPSPAYAVKEERMDAPKCPQCEGKTERYDGLNPHKAGSYECPKCHLRVRQG